MLRFKHTLYLHSTCSKSSRGGDTPQESYRINGLDTIPLVFCVTFFIPFTVKIMILNYGKPVERKYRKYLVPAETHLDTYKNIHV
jgi:hypothetical protein